jgi:hypothetical protein
MFCFKIIRLQLNCYRMLPAGIENGKKIGG